MALPRRRTNQSDKREEREKKEFDNKVLDVARVTRVVAGGKGCVFAHVSSQEIEMEKSAWVFEKDWMSPTRWARPRERPKNNDFGKPGGRHHSA